MHLIDELDRLAYSVVPRVYLPRCVAGLFPLLKGGVVPDVEHGVQAADLCEPRADGLGVAPARLEALAPVLLPLEELARLEVVGAQLVDAARLLRVRRRPKSKLLAQPVGAALEEGPQRSVEVGAQRRLVQRSDARVVASVPVVLPDVVCVGGGGEISVCVSVCSETPLIPSAPAHRMSRGLRRRLPSCP